MTCRAVRPAALLALLLAGCTAPASWRTVDSPLPFGDLWEQFTDVAWRQGYDEDPARTDRGTRVFVSKWRTREAAFGQAVRTRLHGKFTKLPDDGAGWRLEFRVEKQDIQTIGKGLNPAEADWDAAGQDAGLEDRLFGMLRLRLGQELGIQPSYERR
ncbi:MAG: hypothetical protein IPM29_02145 [Planctomycetes bacterium]|nr:hypothetical protein [Planctomycetota bacterium]